MKRIVVLRFASKIVDIVRQDLSRFVLCHLSTPKTLLMLGLDRAKTLDEFRELAGGRSRPPSTRRRRGHRRTDAFKPIFNTTLKKKVFQSQGVTRGEKA